MKGRNISARVIPALFLVGFLLSLGKWVTAEETTVATPDIRPSPVAAPDPAPGPRSTDPTPSPRMTHPDVVTQHSLTIGRAGNGYGKVTTNPGGPLFKKGTQVTLHAVPDDNSVFTGWSGGCSVSLPTCSVSMTADRNVTASFSLKTYTIHVHSPINGVIHPSGIIKANYGERRKFQVIPLPGFRVSEVLVDKASVGAVNSYTFNTITRDHVLEAIFVKK